MPDPSAAGGGLLSNIYSQLSLGGVGGIMLWRLLVYFGRQDRAAKMEAEIREDLRDRLDKAQNSLSTMAHERNAAVQVRLQLETELRMTNEHLANARRERDEARTALARLQLENERLNATNHRLTEAATLAEARNGAGEERPAPRPVSGERVWAG